MGTKDLSKFSAVTAKTQNSNVPSISIINAAENGRRVKISKAALKMLGNPASVQLAVSPDTLIISSELEDNPVHFKVSKGNVYSSALVLDLTERFDLDFNGTTSRSFYSESELEIDDRMVLFFKMS